MDEQLRALVFQAFELRRSPYFPDAIKAIVAAVERAPLTRFEQRQERNARLIRLLRDTDPTRITGRRAA